MFVQIIESPLRDPEGMRRHFLAGVERLHPTAVGWLGATSGVTDERVWMNIIRFESAEAAEINSARPEQGEWWGEGERYRDGEARFIDSTDVTVLGNGPDAAAAYIRIIEGSVDDRPRIEALLAADREAAAAHLDGGLAIWHDRSLTLMRTYPVRPVAGTDTLLTQIAPLLGEARLHDISQLWPATSSGNPTHTKGSTMTTTATPVDNGVDVEFLRSARETLTAEPEAAMFQWRVTNTWKRGTHSHSTVKSFFGLGDEQSHRNEFHYDGDHPELFSSDDNGATPVEIVLVGLASCLTAGVAAVAQYRGIQLRSVSATVCGDMDVRGILGIDTDVRNGFSGIAVTYTIDADATPAEIEALVAQSQKRSAVYDIVTNPTNVTVTVH